MRCILVGAFKDVRCISLGAFKDVRCIPSRNDPFRGRFLYKCRRFLYRAAEDLSVCNYHPDMSYKPWTSIYSCTSIISRNDGGANVTHKTSPRALLSRGHLKIYVMTVWIPTHSLPSICQADTEKRIPLDPECHYQNYRTYIIIIIYIHVIV